MTEYSSDNFLGVISCVPSFNTSSCLTKTIEFGISTILFIFGNILLYQYIKFFGFKGKIYINAALMFMQGYLIMNMCYCLWNTVDEFYSIQTYFNNLYFLCIVSYLTKSYLIKNNPKQRNNFSRRSNSSRHSTQQKNIGFFNQLKVNYLKTNKIYIILYKIIAVIFFLLFTLIFATQLAGDIHNDNSYTSAGVSSENEEDSLFSFLKNSCEQVWYLCIKAICVILSIIVLIVLYKNYRFQQKRIKDMTLITQTCHQKPITSQRHSNVSKQTYVPDSLVSKTQKINSPLKKLAIWMGFNILGEIVDLVESGLLTTASTSNNCRIVPSNQQTNSIVMLIFVVFTVYLQYTFSLWFFYDTLKKKTQFDYKKEKLLISPHDYSQQIQVGHIQMNPSGSSSPQNQN